jgi:uncharacterized protein (TIGR02466 family)
METQDESAVAQLRRALATNPGDRIGWHNLAAAEGDRGRPAEAEAAARRALSLGIAAPETRLVLARALHEQDRLDEAERTFEEAIALRPAYAQAHRDLAQLRWMRTGDAAHALARLDEALHGLPREPGLHLVRSIALEFMDDAAAALAAAESGIEAATQDLQLLRQAAHLCAMRGEGARSVSWARRAMQAAPADPGVQITLCEALLAAGQDAEAEALAASLCAAHPLDQHAIALLATAWRLRGDARYAELHDYSRLVHSETLEAPEGWRGLEAFLGDLEADLLRLHRFRTHPFQQSVRGGSQLPLKSSALSLPTLRALFESIARAAERHLARVGRGSDPFRSRNSGRMRVTGAWSVRLSSGGHHTDHVHQQGWLSAAFYVAVPPDMRRAERPHAGWLRLGRPGIATRPALSPDRFVEPGPGTVVLFPAYMWHGVEPFESERPRLSVALDALPA